METSLPSAYARMLLRELGLGDAGIPALLAGTGLQKKDLFSFCSGTATTEIYTIIQNGLRISGNPVLGLQIGRSMPHSAHGAVGAALASAPTTHEALEVMVRFGMIRVPVISVRSTVAGEIVTMTLDCSLAMDAVGRFLVEVLLASMLLLAEMPQGRLSRRPQISFAYPEPDYGALYANFLDAELRFDQQHTAIEFLLSDVEVANPFADADVFQQAIDLCERLRVRLGSQQSWRERVSGLLQQHPGHIWQIQDIAAALHVSVRSLTRHLGAESSSYQQLLDAELCRQALLHLRTPGQTVAGVASLLGYQDVSSFRRAFRRWQGVPPQDWRDGADRANLA